MPIFGSSSQDVCCKSIRKCIKYSNSPLLYYQITQIYLGTNWLSMRKGLVDLSTKFHWKMSQLVREGRAVTVRTEGSGTGAPVVSEQTKGFDFHRLVAAQGLRA